MQLLPRSRWLSRALGLAGLLLAGCVVSPQPEPPAIIAPLLALASQGSVVALEGRAFAVTPGGSTLEMLDLDSTAAAARVDVAEDGSFVLALGGATFDENRLQAFSGSLRSDPLDIKGPGGGALGAKGALLVKQPALGCLRLAPALEIGFISSSTVSITKSATVTVTLTNGCASDVTVGGFSLRTGSPAFTTAPATGPLVVPAGAESSFTVTFTPQAGAATEEVLFVQIDAPVKDRRPLTLRGFVP